VIVRVEPSGIEIDVADGETLMAAARRAGYRWPTVCGGLAQCGVCVVDVEAGRPAPPEDLEAQRLATLPERQMRPDAEWRLACQLRVGGAGLVVRKRGVRPITDQGGT
jgi:ferredoxin, 2Fe-2S